MAAWTDPFTDLTIGAALARSVKRFGSREAMVFQNGTVTHEQLQEVSSLVARGFLSLGVRRGDMVAIWMAGYREWAYLYYGLARIGAIVVPVNTRYKASEVEYVLKKSRARTVVFKDEEIGGKSYRAILKELCPQVDEAPPGHLASGRLAYLREIIAISDRDLPGCFSFEQLTEAGAKMPREHLYEAERQVQSGDVALIQFTSGTTAQPKGAMLFHAGMLRGAWCSCDPLRLSEGERVFSPQPFFHGGGSITTMLAPLLSGSTMIVPAYFDPGEALRLMEEHRCTVVRGHQPHYIEYLNHPDLKRRKLYLEKGYVFATPDVNRMVYERMGIKGLLSPYGLTENHLAGTSCQLDDPLDKRLNTVGRPHPGIELGIRSTDGGQFLPAGEMGEVCFRGWGAMKGYFDDPEKTAEAIDEDGWLRTGDLGVVDPEGYLRLVGRIKDMVRVGGENVAAMDVEAYLLEHEKVKQVVVVGAPDPRLGEVCAAFVELKPGVAATADELLQYCRAGLASFKVPRQIHFVTEWPMSGTGKIQRFVLRDSLLGPKA